MKPKLRLKQLIIQVKKLNFEALVFFLILAVAALVMAKNFDYPVSNGETHRDYLVARHIVKYGEFPTTGPCCLFNGAFGEIRNSPVYYYLLASLVVLHDNILFLGLINSILQLATIVTIYFVAKKIFNLGTATIAMVLFAVSGPFLKTSLFFWQPHAMQPFVNLSYLALVLAYFGKNYLFIIVGPVLFLLAAALHASVWAILPTFAAATFLILKTQKRPVSAYIFLFGAMVLTFVSLNFGIFFHLVKYKTAVGVDLGKFLALNWLEFFSNWQTAASTLISTIFAPQDYGRLALSLAVLTVLIVLAACFKVVKKGGVDEKVPFLLIFFAVLQFITVAAIFKAKIWLFYFTPVFGLVMILIAHSINTILSANFVLKSLKILITGLLIIVFSVNFYFFKQTPGKNYQNIKIPLAAIQTNLSKIQEEDSLKNLNFFQIKVYATGVESTKTADLVFWTSLERELKRKFLKITDLGIGYELINGNNYIFVICHSYTREIKVKSECLEPFTDEFPSHQIVKQIAPNQPFLTYLAKKMN